MYKRCSLILFFLLAAQILWSQGNGKLQLHFIDVGQGDGAIMITPGGKVVIFDAGMDLGIENCTKAVSYFDQLGITQIDAIVVSHYHTDHIGCIPEVLQGRTLAGPSYDRGLSYTTKSYKDYVAAVKPHRQAVKMGDTITIDGVTLRVIAVNGAGVQTDNENDLSVAMKVSFSNFRAEIGGDLSGEQTDNYEDIESGVAASAGPLDVYKVHHHCSKYSTNEAWLDATKPTIGIISTGNTNTYGHPAAECLARLHDAGVQKTYWTERGNGGSPVSGKDKIAKNIIVEVSPGASAFTVKYGSTTESYQTKINGTTPAPSDPVAEKFAWSKRAKLYHLANCFWVDNINPENLVRGNTPPDGKSLHTDCPTPRH